MLWSWKWEGNFSPPSAHKPNYKIINEYPHRVNREYWFEFIPKKQFHLSLSLQFSSGVANLVSPQEPNVKLRISTFSPKNENIFTYRQAWTKCKRWKLSYLISNAMRLINPSLAWQEKRGKERAKILFIKLRSEKYSINKEKHKHFWATHWTKKDDKAVTLHYITTQWLECIDFNGLISFIS